MGSRDTVRQRTGHTKRIEIPRMRYELPLDNLLLVCHCAADLAPQAGGLLSKLAELHGQGPELRDGSIVQFGWSRLRLNLEENQLIVCEPDFSGDPLENFVAEVDRTLRVQAAQAAVCKRVGAIGPDVRFDQTIVMEKGCLSSSRLYLDRTVTTFEEFSGWFIGSRMDVSVNSRAEDLEVLLVHQLLQRRPVVLNSLQLPVGYFVTVNGQAVSAIQDATGAGVWAM